MASSSEASKARKTAETIARECVGVRVRMLNRALTRVYDDLLRPHGIKFSQANILTAITLHSPVQQAEVARILSLEKSTLSRNLAIMTDNGWIEPVADGAAGVRLLRVTRKGRQLLTRMAPAWREAQEHVSGLLGAKATSALREAVDRLQKMESR